MRLVFNDPVAIPPERRGRGVYWLRIYRDENAAVVLVTEVPGNPGSSISNSASRIARWILDNVLDGVSDVRWFHCYPAGMYDIEPKVRYAELTFAEPDLAPIWRNHRIPRKRIEELIGQPLTLLPDHDEVLMRVIAAGGSLTAQPNLPRYVVVDVADMPPPKNPFRCVHHKRFQAFVKAYPPRLDDRYGREARDAFYATLTAGDYMKCKRYHSGDWRAVCSEAVRIVEALGDLPPMDALDAAIDSANLTKNDLRWLRSIFGDLMGWVDDDWSNGQHRGCAIRASGAEPNVVAEDGPLSGPPTTWEMKGRA